MRTRLKIGHVAILLVGGLLAACSDVQSGLDRADRYFKDVFSSIVGRPVLPGATVAPTNAAGEPSPDASYLLGLKYLNGDGVPRDEKRAATLIESAANHGQVDAQYLLGVVLGEPGTPGHEPARAIAWLTEAAGHGHVQAQFALADSYMNGRAVAAEPTWAAVWYRRAALGGHKDAAFQLALIEIAGRGAPVDTVDAYKWLTIAEGAGHTEARRYRSALKARLGDAERQRAEAEARAFAPAVIRVNYSDEPTILFVQYALARRDYDPGQIDGRIGDRTRAVIAAYARANGLGGTASVTPALVDALRSDLRGRT